MTRQGLWLRVFSGWTIFVFGVLIKNMVTDNDHELAFRLVHSGIAVVSIVLAIGTWKIARRHDHLAREAVIDHEIIDKRSDVN